ncbi:diguanylate cyclase/phosphodiesterase [Bradyrhizobium sp. NFR13]|uniref:putative bifunctional diguanylate cyclase/phosphodiesterase n=1 Tax=Bradyrhizobium sp. NFR13 TaxID=1566285 RepID=UPI0008E55E1C|nr:EAL domain-containing protein [Bradyrhizobium sp. NFR13]SFM30245.1 diguanylate cyclase/phosphodiesterase [Bradyrhizobium sp. NFR13]
MLNYFEMAASQIGTIFRVPRENPELMEAKLAAFTRQVPIMYALVVVNTTALAITFYGTAPHLLTMYLPAAFVAICMIRMLSWLRARNITLSLNQAVEKLTGSIIFAGILGVAFSAWSLSLFPYGDAYSKSHVAFFMAVTSIGCSFCLMHLRSAALIVTTLVVVPFAFFFGSSDNTVFTSIAFNFVVVIFAVLFMLLGNYSDFEKRVNSEKALRIKQAELQVLSDRNFRNSNIDSLTGLPNRRNFFAELERGIVNTAHTGGLLLGILDLDGFKPINDIHGHRMGDRLLVEVADRLRAHLAPHVFLGRLGGDEFVMFSEQLLDPDAIAEAEESIENLFDVPFEIDDITVRISCSIGYADFPDAAKTAQDLFERADYALFFAKQHKRGKAVRFSAEHEAEIREASSVSRALAGANLEQELWIAYQPIIDAETRQPASFEALARWKSPELGNVPPMSFIVAAERSDMIGQLTPLLLRKALEGAATWPEHIRISFNLSAVDVASPLSILKIIAVVQQSKVKASRIDFEITETAVMGNLVQATEALNALKTLGARISLDDFGTGYSSLSCIRELPLDKVKIDRSFISKIETDSAARLILRTMLGLCSGLGHDCIVEGVENSEQVDFLRREHCRFMQGYFFAKPMNIEQVGGYLASAQSSMLVGRTAG